MTERLSGSGVDVLERPETEEQGEALGFSPETPQRLARRALTLNILEDDETEPVSLLAQGRAHAEQAAQDPGVIFNSKA